MSFMVLTATFLSSFLLLTTPPFDSYRTPTYIFSPLNSHLPTSNSLLKEFSSGYNIAVIILPDFHSHICDHFNNLFSQFFILLPSSSFLASGTHSHGRLPLYHLKSKDPTFFQAHF